jgi:hypothetical protein
MNIDGIEQAVGPSHKRASEKPPAPPSASTSSAKPPRVSSAPLLGLAGNRATIRKSPLGGERSLSQRISMISLDHRNWFST